MRRLTFSLILFLSAGAGPAALALPLNVCEISLVSSAFVKLTAKALEEGLCNVEQLKATASSEVPVSPIQNHILDVDTAAFHSAFAKLVASDTVKAQWPSIRRALQRAAEQTEKTQAITTLATANTAHLFNPHKIRGHEVGAKAMPVVMLVTPQGKVFYAIETDSASLQVYSIESEKPIWSTKYSLSRFASKPAVALSQDANGHLNIHLAGNFAGSALEKACHLDINFTKIRVETYTLGVSDPVVREFLDPQGKVYGYIAPETGPHFLELDNHRLLALTEKPVLFDGGAYSQTLLWHDVFGVHSADFAHFQAEGGAPADRKMSRLSFKDGAWNLQPIKDIVGTHISGIQLKNGDFILDVHQNDEKLNLYMPDGMKVIPFPFQIRTSRPFETRDGRVLVAVSSAVTNSEVTVEVFEPAAGPQILFKATVPDQTQNGTFSWFEDAAGSVYLAYGAAQTRVYQPLHPASAPVEFLPSQSFAVGHAYWAHAHDQSFLFFNDRFSKELSVHALFKEIND